MVWPSGIPVRPSISYSKSSRGLCPLLTCSWWGSLSSQHATSLSLSAIGSVCVYMYNIFHFCQLLQHSVKHVLWMGNGKITTEVRSQKRWGGLRIRFHFFSIFLFLLVGWVFFPFNTGNTFLFSDCNMHDLLLLRLLGLSTSLCG